MPRVAAPYKHSDYWLDDVFSVNDLDGFGDEAEKEEGPSLIRLLRLAAIRRATSNFVNILTERNDVPVVFSSGQDSYTDGQRVIISATDKPEEFDITVGLALHEAAHIKLTDFRFINFMNRLDYSMRLDRSWAPILVSTIHPDIQKYFPYDALSFTGPKLPAMDRDYIRVDALSRVWKTIFDICNILEDRRIDKYVYTTASGYRPYYQALYNQYFFTKNISKSLRFDPAWRELTVANYINRILLCIHPDASSDAMPGLRDILRVVDLPNIDRIAPEPVEALHFTWLSPEGNFWEDEMRFEDFQHNKQLEQGAIQMLRDGRLQYYRDNDCQLNYDRLPAIWKEANRILAAILKYAKDDFVQLWADRPAAPNGLPGNGATIEGTGTGGMGLPNMDSSGSQSIISVEVAGDSGSESDENEDGEGEPAVDGTSEAPAKEDSSADGDGEPKPQPVPVEMDGKKKNKVGKFNPNATARDLKKALDVMNGKAKKKKLKNASEKSAIDAMEQAQGELVDVSDAKLVPQGVKVLVTKRLTDDVLAQAWFPFRGSVREENIILGKRLGQILLHKLQIRNDPLVTKQTRLAQGGLDRRLLAQLGMENMSVFSRIRVDRHAPALLHLSLDASGSMLGSKWNKTVQVATAIAYLASKMQNVDTTIALRGGSGTPVLSYIFDSRIQNFAYFLRNIRRVGPNGITPEGLCYAAVTKELIREAARYKVYFINFSDGAPNFWVDGTMTTSSYRRRRNGKLSALSGTMSYGGHVAYEHTRKEVNKMIEAGISILSYYISEYYMRATEHDAFKQMYGETASYVDVTKAGNVLRTLNTLLSSRG